MNRCLASVRQSVQDVSDGPRVSWTVRKDSGLLQEVISRAASKDAAAVEADLLGIVGAVQIGLARLGAARRRPGGRDLRGTRVSEEDLLEAQVRGLRSGFLGRFGQGEAGDEQGGEGEDQGELPHRQVSFHS